MATEQNGLPGLDARREALRQELRELEEDRDGLKNIVDKLTNQIEDLTEEMFGEANERVSAAERARFAAQMAQADAEQSRLLAEDEMKRVRERIDTLKAAIEEAQRQQGQTETANADPAQEFLHKMKFSFATKPPGTSPGPPSPGLIRAASPAARVVEPLLWDEFKEFMDMRSKPASVWSSLYLQRVLREDIVPCLRSNNMMAHQEQLLDLNHTNDLVMESLTAPIEGECFLSGEVHATLTHRVKSVRKTAHAWQEWRPITTAAYKRIVAIADFYTYLRHLSRGIVKTTEAEVYAETTRLRLNMASARLGWTGSWFSDVE